MNKIIIIGNLGRDPELNYTPSGTAMTKFSVADSRRWRDKQSGEQREETTWFNVVAWDQLAETCNQYLHKDGNERTAWDVRVLEMQMLDPKGQGSSSGGGYGDDMTADEVPF